MRTFIQEYVFSNALFLLVDYAFICLLITWKGQYNTRVKSEGIRDSIMVFEWEKRFYWTHFGISLIFMVISLAFFASDFGWFLDIFCWIGFFWGLLLFISFFFIDKTFILDSMFIVVPAYGQRKDYYYTSVTGVEVKREKETKNGISKDNYSMKIQTKDDMSQDVSGPADKIQWLMRVLKEKVGSEKFKIIDGALEEEESTE
ncbi:MAG: hypothetical protein R8G66_00220 [Cytophagales bacterium]|nr:hypothetical protein [Cytophagales bacterium]